MLKRKSFLIPYIIFIIAITAIITVLSILGNKPRKGWIEVYFQSVVGSEQKIKIKYYSRHFKHSFIYGVYPQKESMPKGFENINWISDGSPLGSIHNNNEFKVGDKISDIYYTLKVKKLIYFLALFITLIIPIFYIAYLKTDKKMFYSTDEVLNSISNSSKDKKYIYIISIIAILFAFGTVWYDKGFYVYFFTDNFIEATGRNINFKFPENMFEDVEHLSTSKYWYKTRWSAVAYIYLATHIISPAYTFITGDVVKSIFVAQGIMVSFIFVATAFLLAMYLSQIFSVRILSRHFLLFLFLTQSIQVALYSMIIKSFKLSFFGGIVNMGATISNYNGVLVILLCTLFPYWRYFIHGKWDDWFSKEPLKVFYHFLIIITAFASPAITIFYGLVSGLMFLYIVKKEKSIPPLNHSIAQTLYASMFWTTISAISEVDYITANVRVGLLDKLNGLKASGIIIFVYTLIFALFVVLPIFLMYKHKKIDNRLIKKIYVSISLLFIGMFSHLLLAAVKNEYTIDAMIKRGYRAAFNSAYICVANIFLLLGCIIVIALLFLYLRNAFIKGFIMMFLVSHFMFYIGYETGGGQHELSYKYFTMLHEANKNKPKDSNLIYLDKKNYDIFRINDLPKDFHIRLIQDFARRFNIIDKNAVILEKEDESRE